MDDASIFAVLTSVVATLGSSKAWEYYSKRSEARRIQERETMNDKNLYRDDLRREVENLKTELRDVYSDKEEQMKRFQERITQLSEELAAMRVRVEFLERENSNLKESLSGS